ncbi:peptidoglycan-binding protein [Defluviimonas sp. WL0024]|uniref:Peptidoglycan-binding protein n=1 Tax=Albidovulum salinarum TaxID=2984153 RepID=A0ABT2X5I8_9RHOB|nr:peptidoglycan-binding domain-containing protein [Defluviimonas sp. WL0024]MCU9848634.1 peptidoglycan-binding protein [Defluviimonas sp. WL0024]
MIKQRIVVASAAVSLVLSPAGPVLADAGDAIAGGIIGGIIGGAIVNESNKRKQVVRRSPSYHYSGVSSAQRAQNREVQVALNYFGYPVGAADGVIGSRSRSAISQYQATLGYPATGNLTEYERNLLVGSYHRAVAGGGATMSQAAAHPMGMRGLLLTWRDEAAGVTPYGQGAVHGQMTTAMPAAPVLPVPSAPAVTAPEPQAVIAMPEPEAEPEPAAPGLPTFLGGATIEASLASHCNRVGLMASSGGYTTVATMTDPMTALGEQFCLVRSFAIAEGEEMAARVPGVTMSEVAAQCAGFAPAMKTHVASVSLETADRVIADVRDFALSTGMAPAQLAATAKICLSVGYSGDDMDVAVASNLILAALGEAAYGELLGHHLSQGFGAARRADLAFDWYDMAITAADLTGAAPFAPGQPERMQLVRKAAYTIAGRGDQAAVPAAPEALPAALPSFALPLDTASAEVTE